jgi:hypothetical protein
VKVRRMTAQGPEDAKSSPDSGGGDDSHSSFPGDIWTVLAARLPPTLSQLKFAFGSDAAPEQERSRYVIALYALAHFWSGWNDNLYSDKMMELASALDDLDDGIQPPLLTPAPKGSGRRPEPSVKMRGRAFVALALDALLKAGKENAASYIQMRPLESLCDKKSTSVASAAQEWRDSFSAGDIRDREATAIFVSLRPTLEGLDKTQLLQQAEIFLDEALKIATQFR